MQRAATVFVVTVFLCQTELVAQTLEQQLSNEPARALVDGAQNNGDARRGAILFHQAHVGCVKCHSVDGTKNALGPDLTKLKTLPDANLAHIVESVLKPSAKIRKGFETLTILKSDGKALTGILVAETPQLLILRDPANSGEKIEIPVEHIDEKVVRQESIMPQGIVNQIGNRQQFLDLMKYLFEIREGGLAKAQALQPPPGSIALSLPEYEKRIDHAGLIKAMDRDSFKEGEKIYNRLCINCHGDLNRPGSLPTALRFGEGKFKNGKDPYSMYRTLTHGFGLMIPQMWMVPKQKYDVIHYIRESYLKEQNSAQFVKITDEYLRSLPTGDTFGPEPVEYAPWSDMNYGPSMVNTFEIGSNGSNFAYKGIAVRLDQGPGGIAKGNRWAIFDHDTLRVAAVWDRDKNSKEAGFINWQGIHFDGRHNAHPRIAGTVALENPTGPGWANPETGLFEDNLRVLGRDDRRYGPLPRNWAQYKGLYTLGNRTIIEYTIDGASALESFDSLRLPGGSNFNPDTFVRNLQLEKTDRGLTTLVATHPSESASLRNVAKHAVLLTADPDKPHAVDISKFRGDGYVQIENSSDLNMTSESFTIKARLKTTQDGTIFAKAKPTGPWTPNGTTFFIRGGRLSFDIGWVGVVQSKRRVNDGKWHAVALSWDATSGDARFFIDGKPSGGGTIRAKADLSDSVARVGYTTDNFPNKSLLTGEIEYVSFFQKTLSQNEIEKAAQDNFEAPAKRAGLWNFSKSNDAQNIVDEAGQNRPGMFVAKRADIVHKKGLLAGVVDPSGTSKFQQHGQRLCLSIPASEQTRNFRIWTMAVKETITDSEIANLVRRIEDRIATEVTPNSTEANVPARWPEVVKTTPLLGTNHGPFAVDDLAAPIANPWLARVRLTGHDFFSNPDELAVCSWDGDVWKVTGLQQLDSQSVRKQGSRPQLGWKRIASGLFQPLGVKIVNDVVYVTCRDQIVILRDRNNDGETDYYECFNNDHQVTDHFHEFAMGLQRDEAGNFYYAKSARHALTALVPHHGTLLRVSPDGESTEILANGFRAANGVCLNPDGTFIVTDQEGHWNPKNRINWVREGGFYGNMFGYHNVTDDSDSAMEQPLCWITNKFDRSPSELLWVENSKWGSLNGRLLNLSYGYGKVYVVPHENVNSQMQGGMCEFPIPQFPTGTCRGRFHSVDGALYLSGMFAWGSNQQTKQGGFYRLRKTNQPAYLPIELHAEQQTLQLKFSDPVDPVAAKEVSNYEVRTWDLKRSARYGSDHYNEKKLEVTHAEILSDNQTIRLTLPELQPTWGMEIRCKFTTPDGQKIERVIHNTIHNLR